MTIQSNARPAAAGSLLASLLGGDANVSVGTAADEKPKSRLWANVGVLTKALDDKGEPIFISLPVGLPIDTMKPIKPRGNNAKWLQLVGAKNSLLEEVQKLGAELPDGGHIDIPLTIRLQHVSEQNGDGDQSDNNPLMAALAEAIKGAK